MCVNVCEYLVILSVSYVRQNHTPRKSKLYYDRQSVGQAPIWNPRPIFRLLFLIIFLDSCGFVDVGRPLRRKVGSVVFSFCRASPAQPFSDLSPAVHMSFFIVSIFETPPTWRARFLYLFHAGTG
jgi:hypothetical protein